MQVQLILSGVGRDQISQGANFSSSFCIVEKVCALEGFDPSWRLINLDPGVKNQDGCTWSKEMSTFIALQVKAKISHECPSVVSGSTQSSNLDSWKKCPQSVVFGFSKGGVVLNQLLTEIAHSKDHVGNLRSESIGGELADFSDVREQQQKLNQEHLERKTEINLLVPTTPQEFLESIQEFHYVDVGLNCPGAYQTDQAVIEGIGKAAASRKKGLRILLHGTPRQWADRLRPWISSEKDTFLVFLREQARKHKENKLEACEKLYFADRTPSLQMHFEIIEYLDLS
eukprot:PITA_01796